VPLAQFEQLEGRFRFGRAKKTRAVIKKMYGIEAGQEIYSELDGRFKNKEDT